MGKHERKFFIGLLMLVDYSSAQEPTYIDTRRNGNYKLMCISLYLYIQT